MFLPSNTVILAMSIMFTSLDVSSNCFLYATSVFLRVSSRAEGFSVPFKLSVQVKSDDLAILVVVFSKIDCAKKETLKPEHCSLCGGGGGH